MDGYELLSSQGCGSAVVEMAFALAGLSPTVTDIPYATPGPARDRLLALNPLGQVPVLRLPGGTVLTESAAMVLHLADVAPGAALLPPVQDPARPDALNRLLLFVAAIYPTVTFSDPADAWTLPGEPAAVLEQRLDARKKALWQRMEADARPAPFLAGARPGALDLYVATMLHWRPGAAWFLSHTPTLVGVLRAVAAHPVLAPVMLRHFPKPYPAD